MGTSIIIAEVINKPVCPRDPGVSPIALANASVMGIITITRGMADGTKAPIASPDTDKTQTARVYDLPVRAKARCAI